MFGAPKAKKAEPVTDTQAAKAQADTMEQIRLRGTRGYAGTALRGMSLLQQYANQTGKLYTGSTA